MRTVRRVVTRIELFEQMPDFFVCKGLVGADGTMTGHDDQALFQGLFGEIKDRDYEYLEQHAELVTYLAGDTIIGRFETGEDFYILIDGIASVSSQSRSDTGSR